VKRKFNQMHSEIEEFKQTVSKSKSQVKRLKRDIRSKEAKIRKQDQVLEVASCQAGLCKLELMALRRQYRAFYKIKEGLIAQKVLNANQKLAPLESIAETVRLRMAF